MNQVDGMPSQNGTRPEVSMEPIPLTYGFGLLHHANTSAHGDVGVLLCSAWGVDELSSRKTMFRLATQLADSGYPTLRFDYPGTADAIRDGSAGLAEWIDATFEAIDQLKATCGLQSVVLIGLGLGATVAMLAAEHREDVSAVVLAAPVVSGRRFLRQIAISASIIEEGLGLKPSQRPSGVTIAGIRHASGRGGGAAETRPDQGDSGTKTACAVPVEDANVLLQISKSLPAVYKVHSADPFSLLHLSRGNLR